MQKSLRAS